MEAIQLENVTKVYRVGEVETQALNDVSLSIAEGEFTALVAAGALQFADALPLVRLRARAMQEAVPQGTGAMAAILGLEDDAVRAACSEAAQGQVVEAVNFNAPSQVVVAGHAAAVQRAMETCKAKGAKRVVQLPVSAPFHSSLLRPAAERLREALARISLVSPRIPVVHNVDAGGRSDPRGSIRDRCPDAGTADDGRRGRRCARFLMSSATFRWPDRRISGACWRRISG